MSQSTQTIVFNAVPLLVVAAAYLGVAASIAPALWRERARTRLVELAPAATFAAVGVAAGIWGAVLANDQQPIGGHVWPSFAGLLIALVPPVMLLLRWPERTVLVTAPLRARAAEERGLERERELEASARLSNRLARSRDAEEAAHALVDEVCTLFGVDFAGVSLLDESGRRAHGLVALLHGEDWQWWRELRTELDREPSGIASAVYEASPLAVFDVEGSARVSSRLAQAVGAKSAAYVPLVAGQRVIGVLSLATTAERRAFTTEELAFLQALTAEASTALDRARSASALAQALERERLVATISRRVRSELDVAALQRVAVEETGRALGASRALIRLGDESSGMEVSAEWRLPGLSPVADDRVAALPVANVAVRERRTVAISDLSEPELGAEPDGRAVAEELGVAAVIATPLVVGDELIGVFAAASTEPRRWSDDDVLLVESVAHELGLALHVTRLLEQNRERVGQQTSLLRAAQVLTGDLELEGVLQRLADQVSELLEADAADCYLFDRDRGVLRCAAVHGLPAELVGYEFPATLGLAAQAIREGRPVVAGGYGELTEPVPHPAYAGFTHVAVAPMRWNDEVRGVLGVGLRTDGRRLRPVDAEVLEAFAGLASLALRNAETFARSARQARVQRGFYRIASVLGQPLSRRETLGAVAQAATEALGGTFAAVLMPAAGRLEAAGAFELPPELRSHLEQGLSERTALGRAAAERRVLASPSAAEDDRFADEWRELARATPYASLIAVPVEAPRLEAAGLVLVFFEQTRFFSDDDLELARHLADAARGALERSDLFEAERTSRTLAQQLARTGSLLATELDPAAVLDEVVEQAPRLLSADACAIRVLEDDELVVSAAAGYASGAALDSRSPAGGRLSGDVIQSRAPVAIQDAADDARLLQVDPMLAAGHAAYLGVPLVGPEGSLHGVLCVYDRRPRSWRAEEIEALRALAANTSAALSNAELYQRVALEKERSFAILGNIADGIVAVDRDGHVVLWNAAAEQITGVPADEALGRTTVQVLQRTLESDGDAAPGDRLVSIQRNGEEVWLSLTEAVMRDPAGAVAGRIFAFRDISADRLVEQMKSDFVSAVSHELRTPLTSIYGFAETLLREDVLFGDDERRLFLGYIASESQRLTGIVDALLNVARLDTGDMQVTVAPTNVGELVVELVRGFEANGHELVLDLPREPLAAAADRDKLRQVCTILLDNAIKYSPEGATVTVAAKRTADAVEVRVVDEGPGIPQGEQERIFRKFYRGADADRLGAAAGTGLGLFIARGLVVAMGGRIWVTSNEERGSSFGFELPLVQQSVAAGGETDAEAGRV